MYSCGGSTDNTDAATDETEAVNEEAIQEEAKTTADLDLTKGKDIYDLKCKVCHQENGEGMPGAFPPLAKSDYLMANIARSVEEVITGKTGEVIVNGNTFNSTMPPNKLTDKEATNVFNYILNSWGNEHDAITIVSGKLAE